MDNVQHPPSLCSRDSSRQIFFKKLHNNDNVRILKMGNIYKGDYVLTFYYIFKYLKEIELYEERAKRKIWRESVREKNEEGGKRD